MGVSLGWLPGCKMVPHPWALHSYQSDAPSILLPVWVPGSPGRSGPALPGHSSPLNTGTRGLKAVPFSPCMPECRLRPRTKARQPQPWLPISIC